MVKRAIFLSVLVALSPPVASTQMVNLAPAGQAGGQAPCPAQYPACAAGNGDGTGKTPRGNAGPIIAGLLGLLVLGGVFGRRKSGLPEVVS